MFKKILAGVSSVSLALGLAALTSVVGPASPALAIGGTHSPAAAGETCVSFDADQIAGGSPLSSGDVSASFDSPDGVWTVASSGDPLATIEVLSNGSWSDRTGSTTFSGDAGAAIDGAWICTAPATVSAQRIVDNGGAGDPAPPVDATPYVLVAWLMPAGDANANPNDPTWPQTFFAKADVATEDLSALDSQLTTCGTSYQVDLYNDSITTTNLIAGGHLDRPGTPPEDIPNPSGLGITFKLVRNADCLPQDATAVASVLPPTCRANGSATFSLTNASWTDTTGPEDQTPGDHSRTAQADAGHLFSNGTGTLIVNYTVPQKLDPKSADCYHPVPIKPSFNPIRGCGVYGSITLVDTAYITYAITHGDGKQGHNTVTATAVSPYTFDRHTMATWNIDLGHYHDCYAPAVTAQLSPVCGYDAVTQSSVEQLVVVFDNSGSTAPVTFTIPSASITDVVAGGHPGAMDQVSIPIPSTGSAAIKIYADGHLLKTVTAIDPFTGCAPAPVTADPGSDATCAADGSLVSGSVNVDFEPGIVTYTITGGSPSVNIVATSASTLLPPGTYTVTAQADPGHVLSGPSSWSETIADPRPCSTPNCGLQVASLARVATAAVVDCDPPTLAAWPTEADATQPRCATANGSVTVGEVGGVSFFSEVDYFLDGSPMTSQTVSLAPGTYTVTASPHTLGDGLTGPSSFPIVIGPGTIACADLKTLALTGSSPAGWLALGYGLLAAGMALIALRRVARRGERGERP